MCFDGDGLYSDDDEREVNVTTGKGGKTHAEENYTRQVYFAKLIVIMYVCKSMYE